MAYCALTDIQKHLVNDDLLALTDDSGSGTPNAGVVTEAVATADAVIDAYIRGRYTVPLSPVPVLIRSISTALAICELYDRAKGVLVPEPVQKQRENQMALLKSLAEGMILLEGPTDPLPSWSIASNKTSEDRIFNSDVWECY